ncbi:hypothetical protein ACFC0M_24895 [Streptomyces sp. NPDC056149]|uniref:hypothetical protein n=1 Tax=Streptomyces sp. NPDC056149 TaxID=3345728 RepID=UPI0035DCFB4D
MDFYDRTEQEGSAQSVYLTFGCCDEAEACRYRCLAPLRPELVRNRAVSTALDILEPRWPCLTRGWLLTRCLKALWKWALLPHRQPLAKAVNRWDDPGAQGRLRHP